ncbi:hypothetical protein FOA43_002982 [Brettanomyces nanus]|uniref:Signal recognition particle receptor subunit beta n=1 Tax=Eeniella nana TaxID=13502 RepID=A0A875S5J1_EENNA|nr:uncharacterized protein FOA43_002982 [Brettanomyces nanus]QPG75625.1 hypothetical protein FOA43_002982 [Brettanomyces nanus]
MNSIIELLKSMDTTMFVASIVLAILVIVVTSLMVQKTLFKRNSRNFVIVGPPQSGKTNLFQRLTTGKLPVLTVTSIQPNVGPLKVDNSQYGENFSDVIVSDYPASSKMKNLYLYPFLSDNISSCRGMVYIIDASAFDAEYCHYVANDLLTLLPITESIPNGVDLAIFCNKCDYFTSRKPAKIHLMLEQEITKLYGLKLRNLEKVSESAEDMGVELEDSLNTAFNGGQFKFEMLEGNVDFLEGNVFKDKIDSLIDWFCEKTAN